MLESDPEWFDSRRFVIGRPQLASGFQIIRRAALHDWQVLDLKTSETVVSGLTVEDAGLYADVLEDKYNTAQPRQENHQ